LREVKEVDEVKEVKEIEEQKTLARRLRRASVTGYGATRRLIKRWKKASESECMQT
jgi:enoyl-CoA hydratase/carnithine racemase